MTSSETLRKADAAIDVIIKRAEDNSDCSFREVLNEILQRWKTKD
jgi:hypothetical protein